MVGIFKWLEVCSCFSNHDPGNPPVDAGERIPTLNSGFKKAYLFSNYFINQFIQTRNAQFGFNYDNNQFFPIDYCP
jgi:hypothetical protein